MLSYPVYVSYVILKLPCIYVSYAKLPCIFVIFVGFTVVDLVDFSRDPVVDSHFLGGDWCLVDLLDLRHRLFLSPELGALLQVHDSVPGVVIHLTAGLRLPVCAHASTTTLVVIHVLKLLVFTNQPVD